MKLTFNSIHIHHFMSFNDSFIDFKNKGYCLVEGINKNPKDAAKSNGSGKSTLFNAISFALIGETLQGLKSNLSNIYFNDGCYVELEFEVNNDKYKLIRSKDNSIYGTNLKIFINGKDKSGKGIRESQEILNNYLPDLTSELIGSVVILGQGLPQKFTSNTPSGRKEVLEHLSKSDFMIQDLKDRIEKRILYLNNNLKEEDNKRIKNNTEKNIYETQLLKFKEDLDKLKENKNFDEAINKDKDQLKLLENKYNKNDLKLKEIQINKNILNESLLKQTNIKNDRLNTIYKQYVDYDKELSKSKWDFENQVKTLTEEIKALKEIKDICPTCGQKIPNVIKPDTKQKEADLECVKNSLNNTLVEIKENNEEYQKTENEIKTTFDKDTLNIRNELNNLIKEENIYNNSLLSLNEDINKIKNDILSIEKDKESYEQNLINLNNNIINYENKINEININLKEIDEKSNDLSNHIDVITKMNTLIKRDFRGILLQDIINYIDLKAKKYCSKIFNTNDIEFKLDGNNLNIIFCSKDYENLSGGEKQRIDIITQFAIRDMMSNYLNFSSNILVLDEITDTLDKISCNKVIDFITNNLTDIESIFIISHHADELDIPVDNKLIVKKDENNLSEVVYE